MKMSHVFVLLPNTYAYTTTISEGIRPLMRFREPEGETFIVSKEAAEKGGIEHNFPCRCIQLKTNTSLTDVGITARIASVLAQHDIACNAVSAYHHDYFFVPEAHGKKALDLLVEAF